jgi:hypothetical protein
LRALAICKKPGEETITRIRKKEESKTIPEKDCVDTRGNYGG